MSSSLQKKLGTWLPAGALILAAVGCGPANMAQPSVSAPTAGPVAVATATPPALATPTNAPAANTAIPVTGQTPAPASATTAPSAAAAPATVLKLNLNTATSQQFLAIPGVGNQMLREFQEYRPYSSILQFRREIGKYVDAQQVAAYEKYVYVPIAVNTADAATLQQIPGLDATEAAALIAGRPFASNDAFLAKLAQYIPADQLEAARGYLTNP